MKLIIDNQLPVSLADYLRGKGHQCAHVIELGLGKAQDTEIWQYAGGNGLIWVRLGNCRNAALLAKFGEAHDALASAIDGGQRIVELR